MLNQMPKRTDEFSVQIPVVPLFGCSHQKCQITSSLYLVLGTARNDLSAVFFSKRLWLRGKAVLFQSGIGGLNHSSFGFSLGANEQMQRVNIFYLMSGDLEPSSRVLDQLQPERLQHIGWHTNTDFLGERDFNSTNNLSWKELVADTQL